MTDPQSDPDDPRYNPYAKEAEERWGNTEAYAQSRKRVASMSKDDMKKIQEAGDALMRQIAAVSKGDPASPEAQSLIARHYDGLRAYYEPTIELYRGLGSMYADDARFSAFFDRYSPGLAIFMRDAMHVFCDTHPSNSAHPRPRG